MTWCDGSGPVGVARSPAGRIEIFLQGPPLEAKSRSLRGKLEYQTWYRGDGDEGFPATRILLPPAGHFDQVAAFICIELIRNGASNDLKKAFARTEALIDLAIERLRMADEAIVGLCGEMLLLRALVTAADPAQTTNVVESWKGFRETARDFQLGQVGLEVKTTTGLASSHPIQGVHQVEVGHGVDGVAESDFFLVSIGIHRLNPHEDGDSTSLAALVDDILNSLRTSTAPNSRAVEDSFLRALTQYGSPVDLGYDHAVTAGDSVLARPFRQTFVRCYDMSDVNIQVIDSDQVRSKPNVELPSLSYRINLPEQVSGDVNPVAGLNVAADHVLRRANWSHTH